MSSLRLVAWLACLALLLPAPAELDAATLTVTTFADSDTSDGHCSLREAIRAVNAGSNYRECTGTGFGSNDRIVFAIAVSGVQTISLNSNLDTITRPVSIDGLTQPGASCDAWPPTLMVELDGLGVRGHGLRFGSGSDGSEVRGLAVGGVASTTNFSAAIELASGNNRVECNYIGLRADGSTPNANRHGVLISSGSDNIIGTNGVLPALGRRNVVSNSVVSGIHTRGTAPSRNIIAGNYIGLDATGTEPHSNNIGVSIGAMGSSGPARDNVIGYGGGSATPEFARNVISGNTGTTSGGVGVSMTLNAQYNLVAGNYIGISADGSQAVPNRVGVELGNNASVQHNMIGFPSSQPLAVSGNVISGNSFVGVQLSGPNGADNHYVVGNLIGTHPNGAAGLPNGSYAVQLSSSTRALLRGNVISGHSGAGIRILGGSGNPLPQLLNGVTLPTGGGPVDSSGNCITDNAVGFQIVPQSSPLVTIQFEGNWWGTADGPSGNGPGSGDSVSSPYVDFTPFLTSVPTGCAVTPVADLSVAVTGVPDPVVAGTTVMASVEITNLGPDSAESVLLRITPPAGYAPAPPIGCSLDGGDVVCPVGTIDSGDDFSASLPLAVPPDASGDLSVTASVSSTTLDPIAGNNSVIVARSFGQLVDLQVAVTNDDAVFVEGMVTEFRVALGNLGPSTATGAQLQVPVPTGLAGATWTCESLGATCPVPAGSGQVDQTVTLAPGSGLLFRISGVVQPPGNYLSLAAGALAPAGVEDTNPDNNTDALGRNVERVHDLQVLVETDASEVRSGQPLAFRVRAANQGPSSAVGALVELLLPAGAGELLWTCNASGGASCALAGSGTLVETVDLPSGGEVLFDASVLVGDVAALALSALVVAPPDGTDPDTSNNSDTLDVPVLEPLPMLIFRDGFEEPE